MHVVKHFEGQKTPSTHELANERTGGDAHARRDAQHARLRRVPGKGCGALPCNAAKATVRGITPERRTTGTGLCPPLIAVCATQAEWKLHGSAQWVSRARFLEHPGKISLLHGLHELQLSLQRTELVRRSMMPLVAGCYTVEPNHLLGKAITFQTRRNKWTRRAAAAVT